MTTAGSCGYEITVEGHLDEHWSERLSGLNIDRRGDGTTILAGTLVDQAQLHGVLAALRDMGVDLLGLRTVAPDAGGGGQRDIAGLVVGKQHPVEGGATEPPPAMCWGAP